MSARAAGVTDQRPSAKRAFAIADSRARDGPDIVRPGAGLRHWYPV